MIKNLILALLLFPGSLIAQNEKKQSVFGKIDKAELELTNCDFDPEAEAIVLSDFGLNYLDIRGGRIYTEFQRHIRIKILKDKAVDLANVKLDYYTYRNDQGIMHLAANTYNLDQNGNIVTTKLEKKQVYERRLNTRYSQQSFSLPDVKAGSVIEYKYTIRNGQVRYWQLQSTIPVKYSRYEIDFPPFVELYINPSCTLPYESEDKSNAMRSVKTFAMSNIPALRNEVFVTNEEDYMEKIEAHIVAVNIEGRRHSFVKTWPQVAAELMAEESFGIQLKRNIPIAPDLEGQLLKIKDDYSRMVTIHEYVRKHMEWNGVDNIWCTSGVRNAWKEKKGNSGEVNLILINLLKNAGLKASPVLISTRENGVLETDYPDDGKFNKVLARVQIDKNIYILDGTDRYTHSSFIPESVMCSEGFVLDESMNRGFQWTYLWDSVRLNKNIIITHGWIDEKGKMKGTANIKSYEYARFRKMPYTKLAATEFIEKFYLNKNHSFFIDSLSIKNDHNDTLPLEQVFNFETQINHSGDYGYFSVNPFSSMKSNPFLSDRRFCDVFFGCNQSVTLISSFSIPEGYVFDELPKSIRFYIEDKSLSVVRQLSVSGSRLNAKIVIDFKRPYYSPSEYPDLKAFYNKMYELLDEQIVIKKG